MFQTLVLNAIKWLFLLSLLLISTWRILLELGEFHWTLADCVWQLLYGFQWVMCSFLPSVLFYQKTRGCNFSGPFHLVCWCLLFYLLVQFCSCEQCCTWRFWLVEIPKSYEDQSRRLWKKTVFNWSFEMGINLCFLMYTGMSAGICYWTAESVLF